MSRLWLLFLVPLFSSCSVIMALNQKGTSLESIERAFTREDLLAVGAKPVFSEESDSGESVETFLIHLKRENSTTRALVFGLMDLSTAFLWEFFATPIESALEEKDYSTLKVTFSPDQTIEHIEVL